MPALGTCAVCGKITPKIPKEGTRCPTHRAQHERERGTATQRGYDYRWQQLAKQFIQWHVLEHGWWCPGWGRAGHDVLPGQLTADHITARVRGGEAVPENIGVLCRSCNSAKHAFEAAC